MRLFSFCTYVCKIWNNDLTEYQVWYKLTELLKAFRHFLTANRKKRRSKEYLFIVLAVKESFERFSCLVVHSLQCRRFLWALNLLAKATCWNFPKRGGDRVSQRERGGGGEREEKTPARKHCENEKHPLIRRAWPLFRKWVADNNKTTKQSLQSKDSHCLKKNKLEFIIVFILTESQCNSPELMKLQFKLQFILLNSSL